MLADLSTIFSKNTDISAKDRKKAVKGVEIILAALGAELYTDKEAVYRSIDRDYQASDAVETVRSLYGDAKADSLTEDEIDRIIYYFDRNNESDLPEDEVWENAVSLALGN
jgi:hypothetical protein